MEMLIYFIVVFLYVEFLLEYEIMNMQLFGCDFRVAFVTSGDEWLIFLFNDYMDFIESQSINS